jgi:hypothetical protein
VEYKKWAQAEAALEAHSGRTRMLHSEVPLVVRFADAKRKDFNNKRSAELQGLHDPKRQLIQSGLAGLPQVVVLHWKPCP